MTKKTNNAFIQRVNYVGFLALNIVSVPNAELKQAIQELETKIEKLKNNENNK